jgi:hypothetical protein
MLKGLGLVLVSRLQAKLLEYLPVIKNFVLSLSDSGTSLRSSRVPC